MQTTTSLLKLMLSSERSTNNPSSCGWPEEDSFFRCCFFAACSLHVVSSESRSLDNLKNKYLAVRVTTTSLSSSQ